MADQVPALEPPAIGVASPFVPPEWVAAHGFRPMRLGLSGSGGHPAGAPPGCCPFPEALFAELARVRPRAALFAGTCDQLRRSLEAPSRAAACPTFLLHVPHSWDTPASFRFYLEELRRLGRFLVDLGGRAPDRAGLGAAMAAHDRARRGLRDARGRLSGRSWSEYAEEYLCRGALGALPASGAAPQAGPRLALLGGPLWGAHRRLIGRLEALGASVALDGTDAGERALAPPFDRRRLEEQPFLEMGAAYFGGIPDAFRRPNSLLYRWLERELPARGVQGLVLARCLWCDAWHAEARRLRDWSGLPMAEVELAGETLDETRVEMRLAALLEVLR